MLKSRYIIKERSDLKEQLLSDESRTIDQIQDQYGSQAVQLLEYFNKLNQMGKDRMLENAEDISAIDKYSKDG